MSRPAGEHLTRISINLPTDDLETIRNTYPAGYQLKIREMVHEHCQQIRDMQAAEQLFVPEEER